MRILQTLVVLTSAIVFVGCDTAPDTERAPGAAELPPPAEQQPEQQMRATLANVVEAQAAFYNDHGRFSDDPALLMDEYGFMPVGDASVVINFGGTAPNWGYLATAIHPTAPVGCEVYHGRPGPDEPQFAGAIECR